MFRYFVSWPRSNSQRFLSTPSVGQSAVMAAPAAGEADGFVQRNCAIRRFFASGKSALAALLYREETVSVAGDQVGGVFCGADACLPVYPVRAPLQGQDAGTRLNWDPIRQLRVFANQNHGVSSSLQDTYLKHHKNII